jgi:drug/metabolite transporter (DMT)-like permease
VYTTAKNGIAGVFLILLAAAALPVARRGGGARLPRTRRDLAALLVVATVGGSVPFVLFFEGLARATATQAAFIQKTLVVWVALLAVSFLGERIGPAHLTAVGLLVAGQAVLVGDAGKVAFGSGEAMILAATLLWSVEIVIVKELLRSLNTEVLAAARLGIGTLLLLAYVGLSGRWHDLVALGAGEWGWALLTGVILTGYVATWYAALARAPAVDVTAVLVFGAIVTAALDSGFHGASPDALGLGLIVLGVALIAARTLRSAARPARA